MTKPKTKNESNWKNYLIKSEQFLESARDALPKSNWNAVGLNAVHCAISANDAITVYETGTRSISEKHSNAVFLLLQTFRHSQESEKYSKHLNWLIARKNMIEYETRLFYKKEAEDAMIHAERFLNWVRDKLQ